MQIPEDRSDAPSLRLQASLLVRGQVSLREGRGNAVAAPCLHLWEH